MLSSRLLKILIAGFISSSVSAFAEHNPYHNKTLAVEVIRGENGLEGTILPDRQIKVIIKCNLFTTSKLIVAEGPGKAVYDRDWIPTRSMLPIPKSVHFKLSENATSIICSNKYHESYLVTFVGNHALISGIDHNQAVVAEVMDWKE